VVYTCRTKNGNHNETYGTETLNEHLGVKVNKTCGVSSLERVHTNASKLEQHSLLKVEIVYYEIGRSLTSDEKVSSEPTGEGVSVAVRNKAEHALLVAEVGVGGLVTADEALATADNRGDDLVADLDGLTCGIHLNVLTESDDLTCALVTESYGDKSERITLPLVNVGAANAATLYLDENVIVLKSGDGKFLDLYFFLSCKHSDLTGLGNTLRGSARRKALAEYSTNYRFNLGRRNIHFIYLSQQHAGRVSAIQKAKYVTLSCRLSIFI
jgi:hypothetical protein